jgi:hypothetical protein
MNVLGELRAVAAKLSLHDDRPTCECCGQGKLDLIDELSLLKTPSALA